VRYSNIGPGVDQSGVGVDGGGGATVEEGAPVGTACAAIASIVRMTAAAVASRAGPRGRRGKLHAKAEVVTTTSAKVRLERRPMKQA
jgi:hypothetical protein